jgi:hypothetical protein
VVVSPYVRQITRGADRQMWAASKSTRNIKPNPIPPTPTTHTHTHTHTPQPRRTHLVHRRDERVGEREPQADVDKRQRHQRGRDDPPDNVGDDAAELVKRRDGAEDGAREHDGDAGLDALDGGGGREP